MSFPFFDLPFKHDSLINIFIEFVCILLPQVANHDCQSQINKQVVAYEDSNCEETNSDALIITIREDIHQVIPSLQGGCLKHRNVGIKDVVEVCDSPVHL